MIRLRFANDQLQPRYMTKHSAAADLRAREGAVIAPGGRGLVPTGVWITDVDWEAVPKEAVPELQIRARSGLAHKHGIMLTNGIGTIDADYREEIGVLLFNSGDQEFVIEPGERIAQLCLAIAYRIPDLGVGDQRLSGFGSTGK